MKPDMQTVEDRAEPLSLMEPLLIAEDSRHRASLADLAFDLVRKASCFKGSLQPSLLVSLATFVRSMNCYYSNLIEGHDTHPIDIELALKEDYSQDTHKRNLQLEARAHIAVQQWIDEGGLTDHAVTTAGICEIHRRFGEGLPVDLLLAENPRTKERIRIVPGELRDHDVRVGRHLAVSPGAVRRYLKHFEQVYGKLGKADAVLSAAAAHHRLLWIHPYLDGNGRVARLMSHAVLLQNLDTGGVWSVARGLARNIRTYKQHLANCDRPRRNDLDGRGHLSEEALAEFTRFFLGICIDQVDFMQSLVQPERLHARIRFWAEEETRLGNLPGKAGAILEAILYRGELPRGEAAGIVGAGERHARRIVSALIHKGVLMSDSPRAPLRLAFPATLAARWLPGLFPERPA